MEGEEAKKAERRRRGKAADLWGVDRIEVKVFDFGSYQGRFAQNFIQATFDKTSVNTGEIYKMKVEAGLGSSCDDEEWDKSQRDWAIPKKATNHQHEKEVEAVEKLFMVGVLHLSHPPKLLHPELDLLS